ncbi:UDP-N-acetylglucosamine 2-epimerase (hydrolyzing) [bacterium]|nr:UDP-N-acetylglucosamine 2-epimerase (hydrolyzing) [bacterium]|tara:strand:- start:10281 stop:11444 length:1164 start_codon:yes stop_codon:yes gene_type:complete
MPAIKKKKRKICFVITSKIHYGRSKTILEALKKRADIELQIVVGGSAILPNYGDVLSLMERDGFSWNEKITMSLEGGDPVAMAKTTGIGIVEFTTAFDNLRPDVVVVRGDRFEILAATVAAAYLNIPVAHIEGGDITGSIDESVRHAITKLAHVHFVTNDESKNRVLKMGENPKYIFNYGAPELDFVAQNSFTVTNDYINKIGVGDLVDIEKPYVMVMQHPVTTEFGNNRKHIEETLHAIHELGIPALWFWPNIDAGTDEISKGIRVFRERKKPENIRFIKYVSPEEFIGLLKKTICLVGNSSAGIKECSLLGTPAVNVGIRQQGRMRGNNILDVPHKKEDIKKAIEKQIKNGKYKQQKSYYKKGTGEKIAERLAKMSLYQQKRFHE